MREYHIYEDNGGWYHLAVVENGQCILWLMSDEYDLQTIINTRNDLVSGECELWEVQDAEDDPQNCLDTLQQLLEEGCTEIRELDV